MQPTTESASRKPLRATFNRALEDIRMSPIVSISEEAKSRAAEFEKSGRKFVFFQRGEITFRMDALERFYRRERRLDARKELERFRLKFALDGAQPVRALGVTRAHFVKEAACMREEKGFHQPDA